MRRPRMILMQPTKRATVRQLGRVQQQLIAQRDPAALARGWPAPDVVRDQYRRGAAASHPLVPHTVAAAPGEVAHFGLGRGDRLVGIVSQPLSTALLLPCAMPGSYLRW
eukprot:COSAG05_NODE_196_length_14546_cov_55.423548_15_plen_109_part_00